MNEAQLIRDAQSGDTEAFKMLFERHKKKIYALAYQYTRNAEDTEDIFQDTFIKTYNFLNKFRTDENTNFSSWLYRIGINCSIDFIRKNKKRREHAAGEMDIQNIAGPEDNQSPDRRQRDREIRESTEAVLKTIAPRQRMVFILRHYQQMSIKEISEYLN
ncbi:MAG: sigma-70 family RNA polymerase sigma factor, partial [Candidatus Aminicenantes bacterium]|nr:sigma-70 family RNA polymerase sigma factor [Candidatus Aminicenantes bacterium]